MALGESHSVAAQSFGAWKFDFSAAKAAAEKGVPYLRARLDGILSDTVSYHAQAAVDDLMVISPVFAGEKANGTLRRTVGIYQRLPDQLTAAQAEAYNAVRSKLERRRGLGSNAIKRSSAEGSGRSDPRSIYVSKIRQWDVAERNFLSGR